MKKISLLFMTACMLCAMQAYAQCETVITPSEAATKAQVGDKGTYCIEGYVVSTVDIYCKTNAYENQSFMMADQPDGKPVFEAWRVVGVDHTIAAGSFVRIVDATFRMYGDVAETYAGFTVQLISEVPAVINMPEYGTELWPSEAAELSLSLPYHDKPTEEVFIVSGYANAVGTLDTKRGVQNVFVNDNADSSAYVFQGWECHVLKDSEGEYMPIQQGDYVYITGRLSRYNKNPQIKGGYVATFAVEPYLARVSGDPYKGTVAISGTYEFTSVNADTAMFTIAATPDPGYEFVTWIDATKLDLSDPDAEMEKAQPALTIYNEVKDMKEDELRAFAEKEGLEYRELMALLSMLDKMMQPTMVFDYEDLVFWRFINDLQEDTHVFPFRAVFRETQGVENVQDGSRKSKAESRKVLRDGMLYLMYEGRMYDVRGVEVPAAR